MEQKEKLQKEESTEKILSEMYHYAEYAVTGDSEKALVREYADRLKVAIEGELRDATMENAVLPAVCITKKSVDNAAAKMFQEAFASDLECESITYESKCANYKKALSDIIHLEQEMNESINKTGYATGGEAGHYFYRAVKVAKEALKS